MSLIEIAHRDIIRPRFTYPFASDEQGNVRTKTKNFRIESLKIRAYEYLKDVEETLNSNLDLPIDARKDFMNGQTIRGVILAKLADSTRLEEVRTHYEKDMPNWGEAAIENWNLLIEHLKNGC